MNKLILLLALVGMVSCKENKKPDLAKSSAPVTITLDLQKRSYEMRNDDSVLVSRWRYITNNHTGGVKLFDRIEEDTTLRLINFKPFVVIVGDDTTRYYLFGDTLRYNVCKPDTVFTSKIITRNYGNVENLIIQ